MTWWRRRRVERPARPHRSRAPATHWGWWFSADGELYSGPYDTRDDAIAAARDEDCGEYHDVEGVGRFHLMEARQGPVSLHSFLDADAVLDRVCESVDDEYGGEDGIDWDGALPDGSVRVLERWLELLVRFWQWQQGVEVRTWTFTSSRRHETYTWVDGF